MLGIPLVLFHAHIRCQGKANVVWTKRLYWRDWGSITWRHFVGFNMNGLQFSRIWKRNRVSAWAWDIFDVWHILIFYHLMFLAVRDVLDWCSRTVLETMRWIRWDTAWYTRWVASYLFSHHGYRVLRTMNMMCGVIGSTRPVEGISGTAISVRSMWHAVSISSKQSRIRSSITALHSPCAILIISQLYIFMRMYCILGTC